MTLQPREINSRGGIEELISSILNPHFTKLKITYYKAFP